ncbi:ATP-grasp domain-containing protein [Elusimicrobiota bacterium]
MNKLNVLLLFDGETPFPSKEELEEAKKSSDWNSEISVYEALKKLRHNVECFNFGTDINRIVNKIKEFSPHVIFNLVESSLGEYSYDRNVPAILELLQVQYTGCSPAGMMLCNNKELAKEILSFHRISVPNFRVYHRKRKIDFSKKIEFPLFIKPINEEASAGISQSSIARNEKDAIDRINFIHNNLGKNALVEEFIDGRELYVGAMGNGRLRIFPIWEMKFTQVPDDEPKIATYTAKWNDQYRKKWGIKNERADKIDEAIVEHINSICKRAYKSLNLDGYARFDLRLTPEGEVYIIEVNANPELAEGEDFAASAKNAGINYTDLIQKIVNIALKS